MGLEITLAQSKIGIKEMIIAGAAMATTAGIVVGMASQVFAASTPVSYTTTQFTTEEVATWSPDRTSPTGGFNSTTFGGRSDVLEMRLSGALAKPDNYSKTEGLQKDINNSDSIKADVYIDTAWDSQTVRAGIWGVGNNELNEITSYPIVEYSTDNTNNEGYPATASGWRYWNETHWVSLPSVTVKEGWNTLSITHDSSSEKFVYRINGNIVATMNDEESTTLSSVILNSKNYGVDYAVRWSNFAYGNVTPGAKPLSKDDCKNNNWQGYGTYKNQGQCVSSVANKK